MGCHSRGDSQSGPTRRWWAALTPFPDVRVCTFVYACVRACVRASTHPHTACTHTQVSTINLSEDFLEPYAEEARRQPHGNEALAGLLFQRAMEQEACRRGGGDLVCPVQRVTDFMAGVPSTDFWYVP